MQAGSDLEMPNPGMDSARQLVEAVRSGRLPKSAVDACAGRLIRAALALHEEDGDKKTFDEAAHHELARRAAAESAVLLKNDDNLLPIKPGARVAVIGDFAFTPRYQGAGSSMVNATKVDNLADLVPDSGLNWVGTLRGYSRDGQPDAALEKDALDLAGRPMWWSTASVSMRSANRKASTAATCASPRTRSNCWKPWPG